MFHSLFSFGSFYILLNCTMKTKAAYVLACVHTRACIHFVYVLWQVCARVCVHIFILTMGVCSCAHSVPVFVRAKSSEMGLYVCVWILGFALLQVWELFSEIVQLYEKL